jgi:hypothetical protein
MTQIVMSIFNLKFNTEQTSRPILKGGVRDSWCLGPIYE